MLSLKAPSTGNPLLIWLVAITLILLSLSSSSVHGASLREHRLSGSEPGPQRGILQQAPSDDMLKALEYLESLRQRAGTDSQKERAYHAAPLDDAQTQWNIPRLAPSTNTAKSKSDTSPDEEDEQNISSEDAKSEELLRAVLSTLQQTEKASKAAPLRSGGSRLSQDEGKGAGTEKDSYPWDQRKQHRIILHKKMPLMFEDEEGYESDEKEDEDEEEPYFDHWNPLKRTNENVEEKYTPQNLATLQSIFEELGKQGNTKTAHKRQDEENDVAEDDGAADEVGDNMFSIRNVMYDNAEEDAEDWAPLHDLYDEEEEEVEETPQKMTSHEALDEGDTEEVEEDNGADFEKEVDDFDDDADDADDEDYPVRRSTNPSSQGGQDDVAKLVDYYFLKVLEKAEDERKREVEEERERAVRRAGQYRLDMDPREIYQLIHMSQQLHVPPEDLLDMPKTGDMSIPGRVFQRTNQPQRRQGKIPHLSPKKTNMRPTLVHSSPEHQSSDTPERLRMDEILKILELDGLEKPDEFPVRRLGQDRSSKLRLHVHNTEPAKHQVSSHRHPGVKSQEDYDHTADEDELAAYLATQMLARYPPHAGQKRDTLDGAVPGTFQQAVQDYSDQMDSDIYQNRQSDTDDHGEGLENEAVMKLLNYMNPESPENDDDAKPIPGM